MSLRKSPTLTPKMLAANRRKARRSTGPTTALGFAGEDTRATEVDYARSLRRCMLALRENAEEFDRSLPGGPRRTNRAAATNRWFRCWGAAQLLAKKKEERSRDVL